MAWRAELWGILSVYDVCGYQLTTTVVSKPPQGELGQGGVLEVGEMKQRVHRFIDVESLAPTSVVCYCFFIPASDSLLIICSI